MTLDLETLHLAKGGHDNPDDGLCLLEAVAGAAARDAARDAARAALKPTVDHLQDSAIALFATMISPAGAR